jgi:hypothetical protein
MVETQAERAIIESRRDMWESHPASVGITVRGVTTMDTTQFITTRPPTQPSLLDHMVPLTTAYERHAAEPPFGGDTYDPDRDGSRLQHQLAAITAAMKDGAWHTLAELHQTCGAPEASVSARIRDLRKAKFGSHQIESAYVERGLWRYRMVGEKS